MDYYAHLCKLCIQFFGQHHLIRQVKKNLVDPLPADIADHIFFSGHNRNPADRLPCQIPVNDSRPCNSEPLIIVFRNTLHNVLKPVTGRDNQKGPARQKSACSASGAISTNTFQGNPEPRREFPWKPEKFWNSRCPPASKADKKQPEAPRGTHALP